MKYKILIAIFAVFLFTVSLAEAATNVYFKTDNANINKGDTFSVNLKISSDKSINVIDGTLLYDNKKLFVKEVKTTDSLFLIWAKLPTFDNSKGKISFTGGVPEGFIGKDGQVLKITFQAVSDGTAKIDFQDIFSVYLNDGLGTEINPWMEPANLIIATKMPETPLGKSLQVLLNKDKENNHIPAIILLIILVVIAVIFVKIRSNKKSA